MDKILVVVSIIIFVCIIFQRFTNRFSIPSLFIFLTIGMLFGSDGIAGIKFDNFDFASQVCSVALIFIMFYGGVGTNWKTAKPAAAKAFVLSSLGTVFTAFLVGLFCRFALKIELLESFLIGSVICSTDAASVFSILRSKRMNLKYSTAPLLEVESGSNDPFSYMLTVIIMILMKGGGFNILAFLWLLTKQLVIGIGLGFALAFVTRYILRNFKFCVSGFDSVFMVAMALLGYAFPNLLGGNGYLSVYIIGIILGNSKIPNKQSMVQFFDGVTGLMQLTIFFLLGLLSFPSKLPQVAGTAFLIVLFLTFVARPVVVFVLMTPFRSKFNQQMLVAWAGLRGAASIVFAIMATAGVGEYLETDLFHIVFFIVLFSILVQGTLLPYFGKKFNMMDDSEDVMKTFTDYVDEVPVQFIQFRLNEGHPWENKKLSEIILPPESILILIQREGKKIIPRGNTHLRANDLITLSGKKGIPSEEGMELYEREIEKDDEWIDKRIKEIPNHDRLIVLIKRNGQLVIPRGDTLLRQDDVLVISSASDAG